MGKGERGSVIFPKCCFCVDLKTGVLVLGILSSIAIGIAMIAYIIGLAGYAAGGSLLSQGGFYSPQVNAGLAISVIGTIIFAIYFVSSVLLCVGASKEKPNLLIPWMVLSLVSILWCLIEMILLFAIWGAKDPHTGEIIYNWGKFGSYLVSIFFTIYFGIVVLSLYNKLNVYDPTPVNMAQIT